MGPYLTPEGVRLTCFLVIHEVAWDMQTPISTRFTWILLNPPYQTDKPVYYLRVVEPAFGLPVHQRPTLRPWSKQQVHAGCMKAYTNLHSLLSDLFGYSYPLSRGDLSVDKCKKIFLVIVTVMGINYEEYYIVFYRTIVPSYSFIHVAIKSVRLVWHSFCCWLGSVAIGNNSCLVFDFALGCYR